MAKNTKPIVSFEESFDILDIRVGRVMEVDLETRTNKPTYKMVVDFTENLSHGRQIYALRDNRVTGIICTKGLPATSSVFIRILFLSFLIVIGLRCYCAFETARYDADAFGADIRQGHVRI